MMVWVLAAVIAVALSATVYILVARRGSAEEVEDVVLQQRMQATKSASDFAVRFADQAISRDRRARTVVRLSIANLPIRPAEWYVVRFSVAVVVGALGWLISGWLLGFVGLAIGMLVTSVFLRLRISLARKRFEADLPDMLQLIAGSLRSGLSLTSALEAAAADARHPMGPELKRLLSRARLGIVIEEGLDETSQRMESEDFSWVAMSVRIQKEIGGNLADILLTTAETVRERAYLARQIRALSAEGRMSAYILIALPILVAGWFFLNNRDYMELLWQSVTGWLMLGFSVVLLVFGWVWMRAIVRVKV